jgi:hypothetical protein
MVSLSDCPDDRGNGHALAVRRNQPTRFSDPIIVLWRRQCGTTVHPRIDVPDGLAIALRADAAVVAAELFHREALRKNGKLG